MANNPNNPIQNIMAKLGMTQDEQVPDTFVDEHAKGFDNGVVKREPKAFVSRLYINPLKTMSVSSIYLGLEAYGEKHMQISNDPNNPFVNGVEYPVIVYTSWNSNSRQLVYTEKGWKLFYDVKDSKDNVTRHERIISPGRVAAIISAMKKRIDHGFRMRLEFGGQEE